MAATYMFDTCELVLVIVAVEVVVLVTVVGVGLTVTVAEDATIAGNCTEKVKICVLVGTCRTEEVPNVVKHSS